MIYEYFMIICLYKYEYYKVAEREFVSEQF